MRIRNGISRHWVRLAAGAAALAVSGAALAATGAHGEAYGLNVTASVPVVGLNAGLPLADTGSQTAPPNFSVNQSVVSANVQAAPVLTLTTGVITGSTSSNLAMNQVDASAGVTALSLNAVGIANVGLVTLTADAISSQAQVRCSAGTAQASGTTTIANLKLNALGLSALTVNGTPAPNTVLVDVDLGTPAIPPLIPAVTLAQLKVTLNEQSTTGGVFSVNALHLSLNVLSLASVDTVIGHSEVKLDNCAAPPNMNAVTISVPNITAGNQASVPITGSCTPGSASAVALAATSTPAWSGSAVCQSNGTYATTANATGWADGSITFTATQDTATAQTTVTKSTAGPTPPTVTITTAADPITAANQNPYAVAGACTVGSGNVSYAITPSSGTPITGNTACSGTGTWSTSENVTPFPDGPVTITASQTDVNGTGTATKNVTKKAALPTVTVNPPLAVNQANQSSYSVSGTCSENGQPVTVTLTDAGAAHTVTPAAPTCTGGTWSITGINVGALNDGPITIAASQTNGNGTGTGSGTANKDATAPTVTVTAPPIDAGNEHHYVPSGTCTTGDGDVTVTIGTLPSFTVPCTGGGTWTGPGTDVSSLPKGDVVVTATQTDTAGNTGTGTATTPKSTEDNGSGSGIAPVPVGGLWAGLLLLVTGLGAVRRRTRQA